MSDGSIQIKKAIPLIVITWILSLASTLALVYMAPSIFPPLNSANLSDSSVVAEKIKDSAVITAKLADGSVTSAKILDGTVIARDLASDSIITVKIADSNISTSKIADGAIPTDKVADDAIITIKLADDSVTSAKVLDGTITAADLSTDSVLTINIADGTVTTLKIGDYAVTDIKLASGAIPFASAQSSSTTYTNSTEWQDVPAMSASLTLTRTSNVIITFSAEAWLAAGGDWLVVRAMIDTTQAFPNTGITTLTREAGAGNSACSFSFYSTNVPAGAHTVTIQWASWTGTEAILEDRTMTVIALPA